MKGMKTTLEIPDSLFRSAKSAAAKRGIPLRALVSEALKEKLRAESHEKPWMRSFGKLSDLHSENLKIDRLIAEEFGRIEPEDWK